MARLIIGHTTHQSTTIWVRGSERYPFGFVRIRGPHRDQQKIIDLEARHGFTGVVRFARLRPRTRYEIQVEFAAARDAPPAARVDFGHCNGALRTFPAPNSNAPLDFMLVSCNLHSLGWISNPDKAFERIAEEAAVAAADFTIHCGDQIYYDIPIPAAPTLEAYRAKYLDAWSDSRPTRRFLTRLPQYMILDDHEIIDNFSNDMDLVAPASVDAYKTAALKVYREFQYIHSPRNHGNDALHYSFAHGRNQFFVLDSRTERLKKKDIIISDGQMARFKRWLRAHASAKKFVVTSVPFVAESKHSSDKWSHFTAQREEIIEFLYANDIRRLVFLCGDQHNSHHAEMEIWGDERRLVVHELMSSPLNQVFKTKFSDYRHNARHKMDSGIEYRSTLRKDEFYNAHSNAMAIRVAGDTVHYRVFRTKRSRGGLGEQSFAL